MENIDRSVISTLDRREMSPFGVLKQLFALTSKQAQILEVLYTQNQAGICIHHLVEKVASERSMVQKLLSDLKKKGLVTRQQMSLTEFQDRCLREHQNHAAHSGTRPQKPLEKGYLYLYLPLPREDLLALAKQQLKKWEHTLEALHFRAPVGDTEGI